MAWHLVMMALAHTSGLPSLQPPRPAQLIDEHGALDRAVADGHFQEGGFARSGLNYGVVSVIGPQSSGKSSLLNALFNTNFSGSPLLSSKFVEQLANYC